MSQAFLFAFVTSHLECALSPECTSLESLGPAGPPFASFDSRDALLLLALSLVSSRALKASSRVKLDSNLVS